MRREDESQKPEEAKKAVFSNNCSVLQREKNDKETEKKKRFEYIFPKHSKSVGGEQQSDKEGPGQTKNTHQNSSKFNERTRGRTVDGKQERCRGKDTEQSKYIQEPVF